jgi:hypothetical protein
MISDGLNHGDPPRRLVTLRPASRYSRTVRSANVPRLSVSSKYLSPAAIGDARALFVCSVTVQLPKSRACARDSVKSSVAVRERNSRSFSVVVSAKSGTVHSAGGFFGFSFGSLLFTSVKRLSLGTNTLTARA